MGGGHHHPDFLQSTSSGDTFVHRLPTSVKAFACLAVIVATVCIPVRAATLWCFFGPVAISILVTAGMSRVPPGVIFRRLLLAEPFILGAALLSLLQVNGFHVFAVLVLRSTICIAVMILLTTTTPFTDLLAFMRDMRVPAIMLTTMALMQRYLYLVVEQMHRMRRARVARCFAPGRSNDWRSIAGLIGQLFIRTSDRAERIYAAMCARGWR